MLLFMSGTMLGLVPTSSRYLTYLIQFVLPSISDELPPHTHTKTKLRSLETYFSNINKTGSLVWWCILLTPALRKQRQAALSFEISLIYIERSRKARAT